MNLSNKEAHDVFKYPEIPTLNNILLELCSYLSKGPEKEEARAVKFSNFFLYIHPKYISKWKFFEKLLELVYSPHVNIKGSLRMLRLWVLTCFKKDLSLSQKRQIITCLYTISHQMKDKKEIINEINRVKLSLLNVSTPRKRLSFNLSDILNATFEHKKNFFSYKAKDAAEQLTLLESIMFTRIPLQDFIFSKESPIIKAMVNRTNRLANWVASHILNQDNSSKRLHMINYFICVAQYCEMMGNYNSFNSILNGFQLNCISRILPEINLPLRTRLMLKRFVHIMSPSNNYKNYRVNLISKKSEVVLPYLGVLLRDFTMVDEGNRDFKDEKKQILNTDKLDLINGLLTEIQRYQENNHQAQIKDKILPLLRQFSLLSGWTEDQLNKASEAIKPRKSIVEDVETQNLSTMLGTDSPSGSSITSEKYDSPSEGDSSELKELSISDNVNNPELILLINSAR